MSDITTSYRHGASTQNWEECGRKQLLATLKYYYSMCLEELRKTEKHHQARLCSGIVLGRCLGQILVRTPAILFEVFFVVFLSLFRKTLQYYLD